MKQHTGMAFLFMLTPVFLFAQRETDPAGSFSGGTRNTISLFSRDDATGVGIGGQLRVQASKRINTEWFFDYIPSKNNGYTTKHDHHFGWSVIYYPGATVDYSNRFQPYILAGHCFDYSKITEQKKPTNYADRWTMATQAGLGTHVNITKDFDCSLSGQYMLHFGKQINTTIGKDAVTFAKEKGMGPDGHLLFTVSVNYKLGYVL